MNTTFNFSRFLKVLSNEWRLNLKKMLLFWGVIIILTALYFALLWVAENAVLTIATFGGAFFFICILQGFYLQTYFREFSSKTKTQALFLLPASRDETFWAKFLLGVILYVIIALAYTFIILKINEIYSIWHLEKENSLEYMEHYQVVRIFAIDLRTKLSLFFTWLFSTSAYLFGALTFKKMAPFKSLALWFAVIMSLVLITCIVYFLFSGVWPSAAIPGMVIALKGKGGFALFEVYPKFLYGLGIFICLALIVISRVKYNEKTI